jgi:hypothetical protein
VTFYFRFSIKLITQLHPKIRGKFVPGAMSFCERFPTEIDHDSILNNDGPTALKDLHALTLTSQAFHHAFNKCLYQLNGLIFKEEEKTTYSFPARRRGPPPRADWENKSALE